MLNTDISGRWTHTDFGDISALILMVSILPDIVESVAGPAPVRTFREYLHNNNIACATQIQTDAPGL